MLVRKWAEIDDRSPWGDFWFTPISRFTGAGMRVGPEQAMRLAAVYACVKLLSKTFAVMPFKLWEPSGSNGRKPVTNHWINALFSKQPNRFQNPFEFRQMIEGHYEHRGNAYCVISERAGRITELTPKHPDRMKAEILPGGSDYRYAYHEADGSVTRYARGEIWHLRQLSTDGIFGLNPIEIEREVIGLGLAAQEYGARFFANDATPPGWIEHPATFKDKNAKDTFRESWQASQTGRNRGKTAVLEGGLKYHQLEVKNSDAQYLESRRFTVSEVARIYGVPPHLIGDLDRATFANIEQQSLEYVMYTMAPIAAAWASSIRYSLLNEDDELTPDFGLDELLKGDRASRADFYMKMFQTGGYSTNDVRRAEGENDVEGGDMRFRPTNLTPLLPEDAAKFPQQPSKGGPPQNPDGGEDQDPAPKTARERRAEQLAAAAAERIARKELKALRESNGRGVGSFYTDHARFVAEALGVPLERAMAYCVAQQQSTSWSELETRARLVDLALRTP